MIVTVTLNAALDTTYRLDALRPGDTNRVASVAQRAGGKGVNTARVLAARGRSVLVTGLAGGPSGQALRDDLDASGLPHRLTPVQGATRRTVAVVADDGEVTGLWEPGPEISAAEWRRFAEHDFPSALAEAEVVVVSGSLPPGVPVDAYALLLRRAAQLGVPAVLDADGEALLAGLAGRPALVKPNAEEARRATGAVHPAAAADRLRELGAATAVVTAGADGLFGSTAGSRWHTPAPRRVHGNPTGAGDAATAALAIALAEGLPWARATADAAALAAAAVAAPLAGDYDPALYRELLKASDAYSGPHPGLHADR
ncbi:MULTISPECIES: 1-phosphofructokinase family hexose kinase [Streptacidiphilus]|uniref:1-phosphofructokinase family hexose kinase n=1 Tax=Streptacidiphilus cavernicola TaxID=3342716 RepID=A0ABV6UUP5_9ACTN|nr:hexose kinase [Streptacidiphilus jeojiense]